MTDLLHYISLCNVARKNVALDKIQLSISERLGNTECSTNVNALGTDIFDPDVKW